jgi:hypothetical protein
MSALPLPEARAQSLVTVRSKVPGGPWFVMGFTFLNEQQRVVPDTHTSLLYYCLTRTRNNDKPLLGMWMLILRFACRLSGLQDH